MGFHSFAINSDFPLVIAAVRTASGGLTRFAQPWANGRCLRTAVVHRMVLARLPPQPRNRAEQSPDVALPGNEPRTKLTCQHIEPPSSSARLRSAPRVQDKGRLCAAAQRRMSISGLTKEALVAHLGGVDTGVNTPAVARPKLARGRIQYTVNAGFPNSRPPGRLPPALTRELELGGGKILKLRQR